MSEAADTPPGDDGLVRGGTLLLAAKGVAVLGGFALYWLLARVFTGSLGEVAGTAALGTWGATFGVINPLNTVAAAGTLQMMSRQVASRGASDPGATGAVFARVARTQGALLLALFALLQLSAGAVARGVLNDASYAAPLRVAACIPLFYGLRALYEGYLNGTRRFRDQAILDMGATLLRLVLVLLGAAAGYGAMGAIGGFVGSALCMALLAVTWVRPPRRVDDHGPGAGELVAFQVRVVGVTLATQYLLNVDLLAVKALSSPDPLVADRLAGVYTAAQKLTQVPLSLGMALSTLMFAYVASDDARSGRIVRQGMRVLLLMMIPSAALLAANASETLALVFPTVVQGLRAAGEPPSLGGTALAWLALGYVPGALFLTGTTLVTASGRPGLAAAIAGATLALAGVLVRVLTPAYGPAGAAVGVGIAWSLGLVLVAAVLFRRFGAPVAGVSLLRVGAAGALVAALAWAWPSQGVALLLEDAVLGLAFVVPLLLSRELRMAELRRAFAGWRRQPPANG